MVECGPAMKTAIGRGLPGQLVGLDLGEGGDAEVVGLDVAAVAIALTSRAPLESAPAFVGFGLT